MLSLKAFLGLDGSGFELGLKRAGSQAEKFKTSVNRGLSGKLANFIGIAAIEEAARRTIAFAGNVKDLSDRFGMSTDEVQQWDFALKQTGSSIEKATGFFEQLAISRDKALSGDAASRSAFGALGISEADLRSNRIGGIAKMYGEAVKNGDVQKLGSAMREVGGKAAGQLTAAFKSGLGELLADAPLIKAEDIIQLDELGDQIQKLGTKIITSLAPVLSTLAGFVDETYTKINATIAAAATYHMGLKEGLTREEAMTMAHEAVNEIADAEIKRAENRRKALGGSGGEGGSDKARKSKPVVHEDHGDFFRRNTKQDQPSLNLNALQQMGAFVNSPVQNDIRSIAMDARRTGYTVREMLNEMKRPKSPPGGFERPHVEY